MKIAKTILIIWLFAELMLWIRGGQGFSILETLPFVVRREGLSPDYERLALAALLIGLWGFLMVAVRTTGGPPRNPSRFRTELLWVPATIICMALFSRRVHSALSFADLLNDPERLMDHRHLALLSAGVFGILLIWIAFRKS